MAISIELNEILDPETRQKVESVIRQSIGDRPTGEDWKVWIYSSSGHSRVVVKGPSQTRERFFFENVQTLPEKVRDWLEAYPFR